MTLPSPPPDPAGDPDLRALLDGAPGFLGLLTREGIVLDANRAALALVDADSGALRGRHLADTPWFAPGDADAIRASLSEAALGIRTVLQVRYPSQEGMRDVELTLTPVRDATGSVHRIIPSGRDITAQRRAERDVREAEDILTALMAVTADAIVTIDEDHRIRLFNRGAEAIFGYAASEVIGERIEMLLPEVARAGHAAHVHRFASDARGSRFMNQRRPVSGRRRDGELFPAEVSISHLQAGGRRYFAAVLRDITERLRVDQELERSRQYTSAVVNCVAEGILGVDRNGRAVLANPAALSMLGYRESELIGRDLHALVHHSHRDGSRYPATDCPMWAAIRDGVVTRCEDDVYWRADGRPIDIEFTATPLLHEGRAEGAIVVFRDIAERRRAEARLRDLAEIDELTGLLNRRGFQTRANALLESVRARGAGATLAMLDLDGFKQINDRHGHLAGDAALREVAQLIHAQLDTGDLVARFGGDEFVVLIADGRAPASAAVLQARLRDALQERNADPASAFPLHISLGAARSVDGSSELEALILEADESLYEAKRRRAPR